MKAIYISDLDGTLLRNEGILSNYSRSKLISLMNDGLNFTVASARSVVSMQTILHDIPFKLPVIEFNGSFISDFFTGNHQIVHDISKDIKEELFCDILKHQRIPFVSSYNGTEDCLYYDEIVNDGMLCYLNSRKSAGDRRLRKSALKDILNEHIVCFTIIDREENLADLAELFNEKYSNKVEILLIENQYSPGWYWLTIHDCKATKDQGIKVLLEEYGFSPEALTVFGDNLNDIKMFQLAKNKVAVGNAKPELIQIATEVIGSNEDDSVVKYIMRKKYGS